MNDFISLNGWTLAHILFAALAVGVGAGYLIWSPREDAP